MSRRFRARLDQELAEALEATHGAIQTAHAKRCDSSRSVATEVERLTRAAKELEEVRDQVRRLALAARARSGRPGGQETPGATGELVRGAHQLSAPPRTEQAARQSSRRAAWPGESLRQRGARRAG